MRILALCAAIILGAFASVAAWGSGSPATPKHANVWISDFPDSDAGRVAWFKEKKTERNALKKRIELRSKDARPRCGHSDPATNNACVLGLKMVDARDKASIAVLDFQIAAARSPDVNARFALLSIVPKDDQQSDEKLTENWAGMLIFDTWFFLHSTIKPPPS